ncbi:MAG: hypothetical protein D6760_03655 [Deltaproteobacteria bacterium]|nr:MAG: hypothetical protein D6760_03655 [Deltaproteobacteria bacterium]
MRKWIALSALVLALAPAAKTSAQTDTAAVECALLLKYVVLAERPTADVIGRYKCEGKVLAASDVDATNIKQRQVVFRLDACPGLPRTVAFGNTGVTEVRKLAGDRVRAHAFAGECRGCAMTPNTDVAAPRLDAGHFDALFVVKTAKSAISPAPIDLPAGKGQLTLRSEANDDVIVTGRWAARKCRAIPIPPIFCGGIAGLPCPDGMVCVDWPGDDCDPNAGGADCIGMCVTP